MRRKKARCPKKDPHSQQSDREDEKLHQFIIEIEGQKSEKEDQGQTRRTSHTRENPRQSFWLQKKQKRRRDVYKKIIGPFWTQISASEQQSGRQNWRMSMTTSQSIRWR